MSALRMAARAQLHGGVKCRQSCRHEFLLCGLQMPTRALLQVRQAARCVAVASQAGGENISSLRSALSGSVSPAYREGSALLKEIGYDNPTEIARILDISMNPNSLFVTFRSKLRAKNGNARLLSVEGDMRPVIQFFRDQGLADPQLRSIITAHPPVLSYSIEERIQPVWDYLRSIGVENPMQVLESNPSLLGLDVDNNLKRIVEYLRHNEYSMERVIEIVSSTL